MCYTFDIYVSFQHGFWSASTLCRELPANILPIARRTAMRIERSVRFLHILGDADGRKASGKYAFEAHPKQFKKRLTGYFIRLRASAVRFLFPEFAGQPNQRRIICLFVVYLFTHSRNIHRYCSTIESLLQLVVLCVLYLGIQCRYRTFAQLPQKPDIVMRGGNMFA
ncbi:hypothetical protein OSTOST_14594 [Ostertagia ostertagi]